MVVAAGGVRRRSAPRWKDSAWRVREMAAKVVAKRRIGDALPMVAALRDDPVPRVRRAAERALLRLSESDA